MINSENQKLVKSDFLNHVIEELKNFSINSFYQGDFFLGELLTEKTVTEFDQKLNDFLFHDNLFADAQKLYYGSIIDVQKSMFIDFFGLHIIDYLC